MMNERRYIVIEVYYKRAYYKAKSLMRKGSKIFSKYSCANNLYNKHREDTFFLPNHIL